VFESVSVCVSFGVVSLVGGVYCTKSKFSSQIIRAAGNARGNWKKAAFVLLRNNVRGKRRMGRVGYCLVMALKSFFLTQQTGLAI